LALGPARRFVSALSGKAILDDGQQAPAGPFSQTPAQNGFAGSFIGRLRDELQ